MNQTAVLKKKAPNPNKAQSPMKSMNSNFQYRSSTEFTRKYNIKREQLAKKYNDKTRKEQALMAHKRKNLPEESIPQLGKSKLPGHKSIIQLSSRELPKHNFMFQASLKVDVNTSHIIGRAQGEEEKQHVIQELQNCKQVKRKLVLPATSLD